MKSVLNQIFLIISLFLGVASAEEPFQMKLPLLGQDKSMSLADLNGPVVVDFWASWCIPCRKSLPALMKLEKEFPKLHFVTVTIDDQESKALKFYKMLGLDLKTLHDQKKQLASALDVGGMPSLYIFNAQGEIVFKKEGYTESDLKTIQEEFKKWGVSK